MRSMRVPESLRPGILANHTPLGHDVPLDGLEHVRACRRLVVELDRRVQRIEPKYVVVCAARRTRPTIADLSEIILALTARCPGADVTHRDKRCRRQNRFGGNGR